MCMVVGKGVGGGQSMMTAAVVVNGMVQVREGNRSEHVCVVIEIRIVVRWGSCKLRRFAYG